MNRSHLATEHTAAPNEIDINVTDHGSIVLLTGASDAGADWLASNIGHAMRFGAAYVVEPRYVSAIVDGMAADGLTVTL
jgi:hypothetical protein